MSQQKKFKFAVFGSTGSGKSTFLNELIGQKFFKVGRSLTSETEICASAETKWPGTDTTVNVVDTVGVNDNRPNFGLSGFMSMLTSIKEGLNLAAILIPVTGTRLDTSDIEAVRLCLSVLGDKSTDHILIVFTQSERLDEKERVQRIKQYQVETFEILEKYNFLIPNTQQFLYETSQVQEARDFIYGKMIGLKFYKPQFSKQFKQLQNEYPDLSEIQTLAVIASQNEGIRQVLIKREKDSAKKEQQLREAAAQNQYYKDDHRKFKRELKEEKKRMREEQERLEAKMKEREDYMEQKLQQNRKEFEDKLNKEKSKEKFSSNIGKALETGFQLLKLVNNISALTTGKINPYQGKMSLPHSFSHPGKEDSLCPIQ